MAYDERVAARLRAVLEGVPGLREAVMFGGRSFLVNDRLIATAPSAGDLMVRVDPDETETLQEREGVERPTMGKRTMSRGWLIIRGAADLPEEDFTAWLDRALAAADAGRPH